jgi:hypothetical protein
MITKVILPINAKEIHMTDPDLWGTGTRTALCGFKSNKMG